MSGRGRVYSRLVCLCHDWDSERDFASEIYDKSANYQFPRRKHASAVDDTELEFNAHIFGPDGAIEGMDWGGRKPLGDELSSFCFPSSRRRSHDVRDGPVTRRLQMVCRIPRNINLNRCIGEDGSDLVGLRHGEKLSRGLPDEILDPVFSRPQPPYKGVDVQFVRENRNFSAIQRRGIPEIRSELPIRSRAVSPGPWSPPRQRYPNGFNEPPESTYCTPAIYRIGRMRSHDLPFLPEEIVARRRGSSPYMYHPPNNLRDMDSARKHAHPRSIFPNRSPIDRILRRSTGRLDKLDPQEMMDNDEYFWGPMQSGRLHELGADGSGDKRRKRGERRVPLPSFRPHCKSGDNFCFHIEDGPRPFRFHREADAEFLERSSFRGREFDMTGRLRIGHLMYLGK